MGRIILVKSGQTDFDEQHRVVGNLDLPMNVRGHAELTEAANELGSFEIITIYSAAGVSAKESAKHLGERLGVNKIRVLEDLKNQDFGLWQGLQVEEIRRKHPKVYKQWAQSPCDICPPGGEMVNDVMDRVEKSLKPVLKKSQSNTVALVAPDPLRKLIRCYLKRDGVSNLMENGKGQTWEAIDT
ncbi:Phosphoserine phosphatase 1 [Planctomycetes bacterium Pan216]|uniref:phosphoglycerate mutase (2,3-diphosphoglycerate-dependent) n=1 Tax=Kolteria novifilia TaxID=2527975 RepID=A0A518BCQ3_9BACT|nr:Phosphoserine phosphatase 1 [Planctomycetes bacterium Pan216]